jgi:hypothetical protein
MTHSWSEARALARIQTRLKEVKTVEIKDYVRTTDLSSLPVNVAYRVDAVHVYVDILNMVDLLGTTAIEGETCHKRTLRFLNLDYRAVHRILQDVDAIEVDFHNQRLHAVFARPYASEAERIHKAIATAQLIIDVLAETAETGDEIIPAAEVRVGIDSGVALAVCNGRRGHTEPLFLGTPANHAAKRAGGETDTGIYLTNTARAVIGLDDDVEEDETPLTDEEIADSQDAAALPISSAQVVKDWKADLEANPIGKFVFSGHTPPFSDLDMETLSPARSRRNRAVSLYGDIDGFTAFVADGVCDDEAAKDVVRVLHVLRGEMDAVLHKEFGGRKIRFVGDCIHGVLAEGTAQTTRDEDTVTEATRCAGALRSSFTLALKHLEDEAVLQEGHGLGFAIGFDLGPIALTRLGVKGSMIRCAVGRNVLASEAEQRRCDGDETAIGAAAWDNATEAVQDLFGEDRLKGGLDYDTVEAALKDKGEDGKTKSALSEAARPAAAAAAATSLLRPASAPASDLAFASRRTGPSKPTGFA